MTSLIDTHCHLDLDAFDADRELVLSRALASSVHAAILIGYNPERWQSTARLSRQHSFLRRVVGVHPNDAAIWSEGMRQRLEAELLIGDAIAIGETGLDFYRERATAEEQRSSFIAQIELARQFDLPIVIHQRDAEQDVLDTLRPYAPIRGVMHCFTGDAAFGKACVALGLHLGVGGVATYPKSQAIRDALLEAPRDRLVLETDAPFLAPQPMRGKRNEPAAVVDVSQCLAALLGTSLDEIARITTENAVHLFGPSLVSAVQAGKEHLPCA